MSKPRLLDLFCGAGGASVGYARAGFDVRGIDIVFQSNYPFRFYQGDVLDLKAEDIAHFDAVHASPPCQRWSRMSGCRPGLAGSYDALIEPVRQLLIDADVPYIIENVPDSPLDNPIELCGQMFGLALYRHRLFESNIFLAVPPHPEHVVPVSKAGHWKPGTIMSVAGHIAPISVAKEAMGIDWMRRKELTEAIPPAYTEHIGQQVLEHVRLC